MSAHTIVGMNHETAAKLDTFWDTLSLEHRAALHTAFNFSNHRPGYARLKNADEILMNAESGRTSISSVRGDFLRFLVVNVATCDTPHKMMNAILEYGNLSGDEQEKLQNPR